MWILLLPLFFLVVLRWRWTARSTEKGGPLASFVETAVLSGAAIWVSVELLSRFGVLRPGPLAAFWIAAATVVVAAMLLRAGSSARRPDPGVASSAAIGDRGLLLGLGFLVLCVGAVAVAAPPNTWDSQTYHLPRVAHWIQNGDVEPYATHIERQVYFPPFAEYAILQTMLLSGSDRWAGLVQWFSLLGSLAICAGITRQLGGGTSAAVLAAVFAGTMPMALLQGSSTQTDLVVSFWILAFVWLSLRAVRRDDTVALLTAGVALGLAGTTKTLAAIWTAPFWLWLIAASFRRKGRSAAGPLAAATGIALVLIAPFLLRNLSASGHPLGPPGHGDAGRARHANEVLGISTTVSNALRNAALHLPVDGAGAERAEAAVRSLLSLAGLDADDPRTTYPTTRGYFYLRGMSLSEGLAGNPLHLPLLVLALGVGLFAGKRGAGGSRRFLYGLAVAAGPLLFFVLLKWQAWGSRLHLPFFLLGAPVVGRFVAERGRRIALGVGALLLLAALPWALGNSSRPLVGPESVFVRPRLEQYFADYDYEPVVRRRLVESYRTSAAWIRDHGVERLGLVLAPGSWEYPLWVLLGNEQIRIRSVLVRNSTGHLRPSGPSPEVPDDAILFVYPMSPSPPFDPGPEFRVVHRSPLALLLARR